MLACPGRQGNGGPVIIGVDVSSETPSFTSGSGLDIILRSDAVTRIYLNDLLLADADVLIRPDVCGCQWADFSGPRELFRAGEKAALESLPALRSAIHKAADFRKTLGDRFKMIKDKIKGTFRGGKQRNL